MWSDRAHSRALEQAREQDEEEQAREEQPEEQSGGRLVELYLPDEVSVQVARELVAAWADAIGEEKEEKED